MGVLAIRGRVYLIRRAFKLGVGMSLNRQDLNILSPYSRILPSKSEHRRCVKSLHLISCTNRISATHKLASTEGVVA